MPEKLSESTWIAFIKKSKLDLDDSDLRKALAKFDNADESKSDHYMGALKELIEQLKKQVPLLVKKKKELGDKPFALAKDKVNELLEMAERQSKESHKAQSAAVSDEDEEDEEDSPALLTSKMIPLLREVRKPDVRMHALICTAGKQTSVLLMRRPIARMRRKLLAESMDAKGGVKYIVGECFYENSALTFVVRSPAAKLAKRVREALLAQTALRVKVRVRGEDGQDDEDGEPVEEGNISENVSTRPTAAVPNDPAVSNLLKDQFDKRLAEIEPQVQAALKAQTGDVSKIRAIADFVREKGDGAQYKTALAGLDGLQKLLDTAGISSASLREQPEVASDEDPRPKDTSLVDVRARLLTLGPQIQQTIVSVPTAKASLVQVVQRLDGHLRQGNLVVAQAELKSLLDLLNASKPAAFPLPSVAQMQKARLNWQTTRTLLRQRLRILKLKLLAHFDGKPEAAQAGEASDRLTEVLGELDEELIDTLDEALNASDPVRRRELLTEARQCIDDYANYVQTSPLVADLDDNPFVALDIRSTVLRTTQALGAALA